MTIATKNNGEPLTFNLDKLLTTRMLIQANSGAGKSYAIRKLLEETHSQVQHIVLDMEGEFSSLREQYDYLLIGKEGADVQIELKSAELLARKILELRTSTIIDLYELKHHERILFVKRFIDSLMNAPKKLWNPVLIIVDEAHVLCPEKSKAESAGSIIDLMCRGRKRGYCGVLATQRISKLHKDSAAEANNKLVGRTGLDIDMKRASEELGFTNKEDTKSLRRLCAGEFFAFGPAFTEYIERVTINKVKTTHPEAGQRIGFTHTPPTAKIKAMLAKLIDLPQKADEELKEKKDYMSKIRSLEAQLRTKEQAPPSTTSIAKLVNRDIEQLKKANIQVKSAYEKIEHERNSLSGELKSLKGNISKYAFKMVTDVTLNNSGRQKLTWRDAVFVHHLNVDEDERTIAKPILTQKEYLPTPRPNAKINYPNTFPPPDIQTPDIGTFGDAEDKPLGKCAKTILGFLVKNPDKAFTKIQVGCMTGYSPKSSSFHNALSNLNSKGHIRRDAAGKIILGDTPYEELVSISGETYSVNNIKPKLGKCPLEIFEVLLANPEETYTKEELAQSTPSNYSPTSSSFHNSLSKLNSLGLMNRDRGQIRLNPEVQELA